MPLGQARPAGGLRLYDDDFATAVYRTLHTAPLRRVAQEWPRINRGGEETCMNRVLRQIGCVLGVRVRRAYAPRGGLLSYGTAEPERRRDSCPAGLPRRRPREWSAAAPFPSSCARQSHDQAAELSSTGARAYDNGNRASRQCSDGFAAPSYQEALLHAYTVGSPPDQGPCSARTRQDRLRFGFFHPGWSPGGPAVRCGEHLEWGVTVFRLLRSRRGCRLRRFRRRRRSHRGRARLPWRCRPRLRCRRCHQRRHRI